MSKEIARQVDEHMTSLCSASANDEEFKFLYDVMSLDDDVTNYDEAVIMSDKLYTTTGEIAEILSDCSLQTKNIAAKPTIFKAVEEFHIKPGKSMARKKKIIIPLYDNTQQ